MIQEARSQRNLRTSVKRKMRQHPKPDDVRIQVRTSTQRGYAATAEKYPFSKLKPCKRLDNSKRGVLEGECVFLEIDRDAITGIIAVGNKRCAPYKLATRKHTEIVDGAPVEGFLVYKLPLDEDDD